MFFSACTEWAMTTVSVCFYTFILFPSSSPSLEWSKVFSWMPWRAECIIIIAALISFSQVYAVLYSKNHLLNHLYGTKPCILLLEIIEGLTARCYSVIQTSHFSVWEISTICHLNNLSAEIYGWLLHFTVLLLPGNNKCVSYSKTFSYSQTFFLIKKHKHVLIQWFILLISHDLLWSKYVPKPKQEKNKHLHWLMKAIQRSTI